MNKKAQVQGELDDMQEIIHREREDLMERIRELTRDIRKQHLIIDQFIPANEYMRIEKRAEWSEDINDWVIPNVAPRARFALGSNSSFSSSSCARAVRSSSFWERGIEPVSLAWLA